jgi:hypothetical protein
LKVAGGDLNVLTDDDYKTLSNMFVWLKAVIDMGLVGDTDKERQDAIALMDRFDRSSGIALIS